MEVFELAAVEVTGVHSSFSQTVGRIGAVFDGVGGSGSANSDLRLVVRRERADIEDECAGKGQKRLFCGQAGQRSQSI